MLGSSLAEKGNNLIENAPKLMYQEPSRLVPRCVSSGPEMAPVCRFGSEMFPGCGLDGAR